MWTAKFWKDLGERVIASFAGAFISVLTVDGLGLLDVNWADAASVAALAGLVSLAKGLVASRIGDPTSASLTREGGA
jgi:hypothetical protein